MSDARDLKHVENVLPSEETEEPLTDHQGPTPLMNFHSQKEMEQENRSKRHWSQGRPKSDREHRNKHDKHGVFMARGGKGRPHACSI